MDHHDDPLTYNICSINNLIYKIIIGLVAGPVLCLFIFGDSVKADVVPQLDVAEYYNDNVEQAPKGAEQDAYITEIQPGVRAVHDGARIDAQFDYKLQALYFSADHDKDEVYHNAAAHSNVIIVPQNLYLDANASYTDQLISPDGLIDIDNLSSRENNLGITTYRLSPYLRKRHGNSASSEIRIEQEKVQYTESTSPEQTDSTSTTSSINISSGPAFDQVLWRFYVSKNKLTSEEAETSTIQNATVEMTYRVSPKIELIANAGYEDNNFQHSGTSDDPSGEFWGAGVGWSPSSRSQLRLIIGERYFGKTSLVSFKHQTRRSNWSVDYSEQIITTPELQQPVVGDENAPTGDSEENGSESSAAVTPGLRVRAASVILMEKLTISAGYNTGKTSFSLNISDEVRKYQNDGGEEEIQSGSFNWSWRFQPRTTLLLSGARNKLKFQNDNRVDYVGVGKVSVERQVRRDIRGSIGVKTINNNSSDNSFEYDRNLAYVSFRMEF